VTREVDGVIYQGGADPDTTIMPGDTVTVHERIF
jgi:hypothetical protein